MSEKPEQHIRVAENGPYLVSGSLPLGEQAIGIDTQDNAWTWIEGEGREAGERYALRRCGQSSNKPFCDGTHAHVGWRAD